MKKVVVAMSGGIDSSVTAFILKKNGFDVTAIHLRLFNESNIKCCGSSESEEVFKRVCSYLGIKYYVKDARALFKENVIDNFVESYLSGLTPNPCVECNRFIKFNYLLNLSQAMGADFIATGHYAKITNKANQFVLERGVDPDKDQSYFLYCIKKEYLSRILFPLGDFLKKDVKKIAVQEKIPVDISVESKDICFIPEGNYSIFLKKHGYAKSSQGYIKDTSGKILGRHNGYFNFTLGQRKKLGISCGKRMYVVGIRPEKNEVIVGDLSDAFKKKICIVNLNLLREIKNSSSVLAQIRYRHTPSKGKIEICGDRCFFEFDEPQFALTPGQSCVFYDENNKEVLGGGIIKEVID